MRGPTERRAKDVESERRFRRPEEGPGVERVIGRALVGGAVELVRARARGHEELVAPCLQPESPGQPYRRARPRTISAASAMPLSEFTTTTAAPQHPFRAATGSAWNPLSAPPWPK